MDTRQDLGQQAVAQLTRFATPDPSCLPLCKPSEASSPVININKLMDTSLGPSRVLIEADPSSICQLIWMQPALLGPSPASGT